MKSIDELPERIRAKIRVNEDTGCWEWTASLNGSGYGRVWETSGPKMAHRVVYEALSGAIPCGLTIDHLCRVRRCVNPSHLEAVTMRENVLRGETVVAANAAATKCKHGHDFAPCPQHWKKKQRLCMECREKARAKYEAVTGRRTKKPPSDHGTHGGSGGVS